ncbi:MAG: D-aminoacyl-tRNA deacylase [bacterium]|nr:D-aminoacyl-tRNA deacylase [bacterium]
MRIVLQRVSQAQVSVEQAVVGKIAAGLVVLLGIEQGDTEAVVAWGARKTAELRIFQDDDNRMNRSLLDVGGAALVISQFTLLGDTRKGRRPSFTEAAEPETAERLYQYFAASLRQLGVQVETGVFAAKMSVSLVNEGPVTLLLERREKDCYLSE